MYSLLRGEILTPSAKISLKPWKITTNRFNCLCSPEWISPKTSGNDYCMVTMISTNFGQNPSRVFFLKYRFRCVLGSFLAKIRQNPWNGQLWRFTASSLAISNLKEVQICKLQPSLVPLSAKPKWFEKIRKMANVRLPAHCAPPPYNTVRRVRVPKGDYCFLKKETKEDQPGLNQAYFFLCKHH